MHHLIFDMDGVLADSWDECTDCLVELKHFSDTREGTYRRHAQYSGTRPDHARGQRFSRDDYEARLTKIRKLGKCLLTKNVPLFGSFIEELKSISESKMAIVSANSGIYVNHIVKQIPLSFTHILSFDEGPSKEDKIENICKDWGIPVSKVIYVTDTLADVYELETIMPREHIIGCAWGYCGYAVLREELPKEQILREPQDFRKVLSTIHPL
jgi:phosphoglycolate phosphatase-like HAD superfamily hydrolase